MEAPAPPIGTARIYRMNTSQRVFSLIFSGLSAIGWVAIWYGVLAAIRKPDYIEMMIPVVLLIAGVLFSIRAFRNSVYLSGYSIEYKSMTGSAILPFDKIKGRRRYKDKGDSEAPSVWHMVLVPNDDGFPKMDIPETYQFDQYFHNWFNALPDLDLHDNRKYNPANW